MESTMRRRQSADPGRWVVLLLLTILALATIFPFVWMASTSVKPMGDVLGAPERLLPLTYDFSTYTKIWSEVPFARYFVNSLIFSSSVVVIALFLNSLAGYAFARLPFKGRNLLFILILCTMMIPFQVIMTPLFIIIYKLGMIDTYQGLIIPKAADAFGIFMMRQFFLTLPRDLEESGRIDGANEFRIYFRIMLPLCKPAFVTLGVFIFMGNWNDLLYPLLLTNSEQFRPIQAAIALFAGKYGTDYSFVMTGLLLASVPTIIAYICAQRFFVSGIAMTGIK
ncbi:carbohydrate ABC transporter permease [Cohnella candidum]|uniref:Carbohydrate ABC transporter permease n=1 Tax=Cohnella candidum TaxID=2674991 RepID=A0A3G3JXU5_9BACL|nr:carbohydrate ABC transporter permease [Cohnella candidum]AYQ73078.1 carbohydrate ABC transporter permease [Cohnella candidum]